jgi:hypothetical protein
MLREEIRAEGSWGRAIRLLSALTLAALALCMNMNINAKTNGPSDQAFQQNKSSAMVPLIPLPGSTASRPRALPWVRVLPAPPSNYTVAQEQPLTVSPATHQGNVATREARRNSVLPRKSANLLAGLILIQLFHSHHGQ